MENIMLDEKKKNLKIVDFGLSNTFSPDNLLKTHCGSPEYAAPELFISNQEYGPEVDLWSLGINMFAMVTGRLPFSTPYKENRRQRLMQQIQNGLGVIHGREITHLSEECQELLSQLIEPSPELRLPLLDIEVHPWITNMREMVFHPYQQPPKDVGVRRMIIDKTACLLNVNAAKIEGIVHEYRFDDVSAIFNLMMDQYLVSKGFWDRDHTIKKEVKRPKTVEIVLMPKTPQESREPEVENIKLRTPTIIGMVRPSQRDPERRTCMSADFELSAVSTEIIPRKGRAKTATFPETGAKTRPFGNATTANSVIARYYNFGTPSSPAQPPKACSCPPTSQTRTTHVPSTRAPMSPVISENKGHSSDILPTTMPVMKNEEHCEGEVGQIDNDQPHSKGDGPMRDGDSSQQYTKQSIKKTPVAAVDGLLHSKESNISKIKTNAESAHDVKVIDMSKYFNFKHGYMIKETSISNFNSQKGQEMNKEEEAGPLLPVKLCSAHRDKIMSEMVSPQDVPSCETSRSNSPTKTSSQRSELARQKIMLSTRPVNALFRPHHAYPSLQKSLLLTKRAWQSRFSQCSRDSAKLRGKSKQHAATTPSGSTPHSHQRVFSLSRSGCGSPRARLPTPVAMLHSTEDCPRSTKAQRDRSKQDSLRRNAMPPRLEWKRIGIGKSSSWMDEVEGKAVIDDERETNAKKLQEMMSRDSIHQSVPNGNIRVNSAKMESPPKEVKCKSSTRKNTLSGSRCARTSSNVHKSCMIQPHRGPYKMEKYTGQHQRSQTYPIANHDRVIDMGEQHMMSLLQEASDKFEDSIKKAEKGKHLSFKMARNYHGNKSSQSGSTNQKVNHLQQQNMSRLGPPDDETVALQRGQRVQIVKGSLDINSKPPPILSSKMALQQVFNVQASRDIQPVTGLMKSKQGPQGSIYRKKQDKEWDAGYRLERKVSDTIKRGGSAIRKTPDLLLNCI